GRRTVASEAVSLSAGPHAIVVEYFDDVGGHNLTVRYRGPGIGNGTSFVEIPDVALRSGTYIPPVAPSAPTGLTATAVGMEQINLSWQFADVAMTDYEGYRVVTAGSIYDMVVL